jgi:ribosomal protein S12 methylthiotransferase
MQAQAEITEERLRRYVGGKIKLLVEEANSKGGWGRAYLQAPEVDGKIYFSEAAKPGEFRFATVNRVLPPYDLHAVLEK